MSIILASASPRRSELLGRMGLDFTVLTAPHDETMDPFADPSDEVARVSLLKAQAVLPRCQSGDIVIAADTIVCVDDRILGKPHTAAEAAEMLRLLSGREHQVRTGVTVCTRERAVTEVDVTGVRFRTLTEAEIAAYVRTGEPMDKAGAYGIQGLASIFVESLRGDYFNVMGLPLCRLSQILQQFGVAVLGGAETR